MIGEGVILHISIHSADGIRPFADQQPAPEILDGTILKAPAAAGDRRQGRETAPGVVGASSINPLL